MNKNASDYLESINRVIVPTFILAVQKVVKIKPNAEFFVELELGTST
jgi:hypothetical protein